MDEEVIFSRDKAIKACEEVEESNVFGENTKRVVRNTREALEESSDIITFEIKGYELIEKTVKAQGTSGRVYVPWVGHRVAIIRLD